MSIKYKYRSLNFYHFLKISIYLFIISISFLSCAYFSTPLRIRNGLKYCYNNEYNGIDTLLNIHGYYKCGIIIHEINSKGKYVPLQDTAFNRLMFFSDGTFVKNINSNGFNSIEEYFKEVNINPKDEKSLAFFKWFYWGKYIICSDTLKIQYLNHPYTPSPTWVAYEDWFKIIDKNMIKWITSKKLFPKSGIDYYDKIIERRTFLPAKFIPLDIIPSSYCWLKEEKWFWCNKDDYKEYMKQDNRIKIKH